jgi:hypothetical protein
MAAKQYLRLEPFFAIFAVLFAPFAVKSFDRKARKGKGKER